MGARLVVDKDALLHNYQKFCEISKVEVIPVLKSNAYGLGILAVADFFCEAGVKRLAVSRVSEAELLANSGKDVEIVLLTSTDLPEDAERAVRAGVTVTCGSLVSLKLINSIADKLEKKVNVHLLIDTGFGHSGVREREYESVISTLPVLQYVNLTGIFTQFAESFAKKPDYTEMQNERFEKAVRFFSGRVPNKLLVHAANTSAALKFPETRYDAVRIGSGLLGRVTGGDYGRTFTKIGWLECEIAELKTLQKGESIGYSRQFTATGETKIALVHTGLADGLAFDRQQYGRSAFRKLKDAIRALLSIFKDDRIFAKIGKKKVPVLGKISQHCLAVDVTDLGCEVGEKVRFEINPLFVPSTVQREYR